MRRPVHITAMTSPSLCRLGRKIHSNEAAARGTMEEQRTCNFWDIVARVTSHQLILLQEDQMCMSAQRGIGTGGKEEESFTLPL